MIKVRNLLVTFLLLGLVVIEVFSSVNNVQPEAANSQRQLNAEEQSLILSILETDTPTPTMNPLDATFLDINLPDNPGDIGKDIQYSSNIIYRPLNPAPSSTTADGQATLPAASLLQPNQLLQNVLPPLGTDLYYAYQDGSRAWYERGDNVLVIALDETIRSFNKTTGEANDWLQEQLAYPPIDDPEAIANYQNNYNAKQVAETSTWILMEFPSGGVLKVLKTSYTTTNTGGTFSGNLPHILPGYDSW